MPSQTKGSRPRFQTRGREPPHDRFCCSGFGLCARSATRGRLTARSSPVSPEFEACDVYSRNEPRNARTAAKTAAQLSHKKALLASDGGRGVALQQLSAAHAGRPSTAEHD